MITGQLTSNGRKYAFGAYAALALLLFYILYFLDTSGFSIKVTYDATHTPNMPATQRPISHSEFSIHDKVAVIVESRNMSSLPPLLAHFSSVLGSSWPIVLFTHSSSDVPVSRTLKRLVSSRRLDVRYLPDSVNFTKRQDVSEFLTTPWLYEQLAPAKHMLFFQSDSILCAKSEFTVDDFLEYDFIGAPIEPTWGHGFNGGLSLRNRTMVLDIVNKYQREKESNRNQTDVTLFEDQWFYEKMLNETRGRLPSTEVAMRFAVETIWYDRPMGYHQIQRWQPDRLAEVDAWCPEHRLVTGGMIPA